MVLSEVNIGTRYLLPAFPLLIILTSRLWMDRPDQIARADFRQIAKCTAGDVACRNDVGLSRVFSVYQFRRRRAATMA